MGYVPYQLVFPGFLNHQQYVTMGLSVVVQGVGGNMFGTFFCQASSNMQVQGVRCSKSGWLFCIGNYTKPSFIGRLPSYIRTISFFMGLKSKLPLFPYYREWSSTQ